MKQSVSQDSGGVVSVTLQTHEEVNVKLRGGPLPQNFSFILLRVKDSLKDTKWDLSRMLNDTLFLSFSFDVRPSVYQSACVLSCQLAMMNLL